MRRAETLLVAIVAAFALFVGIQVARRPMPTAAAPNIAHATPDSAHADVGAATTQSAIAAPERNVDEIRARLAAATDSYATEMLDDLHGQLVRWPDRTREPLRVWVQSAFSIPDWNSRDEQAARDAFSDWLTDGIPLRVDFILDSATADVHVAWLDRFPPSAGLKIGYTRRTTDQNGWIVAANIVLAVHDSAGRALAAPTLGGALRHEAGHALGLGHSHDPMTLMYPSERVTEIEPRDRATLRLLYALPPGSVR